MSREAREVEIARIFKGFKSTADVAIFVHALNTYGHDGSLADRVSKLSPEDFETFYGDVMSNWGDSEEVKP